MKSVIINIDDSLASIAINRPEVCNALTPEILQTLRVAIESLGKTDSVCAVAIIGRGTSFSAGYDVVSLYSMTPDELAAFMDLGRSCAQAIEDCPKPVIGAVDGPCLGGGFEIMLACDLVFATKEAIFGFSEAKTGNIPGFQGTQRAMVRLGADRAKEMVLNAQRIDAPTALSWGLINRVVSKNELLSTIQEAVAQFTDLSPQAREVMKNKIKTSTYECFNAGMQAEREDVVDCFHDPRTESNRAAFSERSSRRK